MRFASPWSCCAWASLGPPARCPLTVSFLGEGSPTRTGYRERVGTRILTSLLEDLVPDLPWRPGAQDPHGETPCRQRGFHGS